MTPTRQQYTLAELMGLVALCAVAMALLVSPAWRCGVLVLVVIPGFIGGRLWGGKAVLGGTLSGCLIATVLNAFGLLSHYSAAGLAVPPLRSRLVEVYFGFFSSLFYSFATASLIECLVRRLQGRPGPKPVAANAESAEIRFFPDNDRPLSDVG